MEVTDGPESLILSNVLFQNDFENPKHTNFVNCSPDFAQNLVSSLYGDIFDQQWTVETIQINGPENQYQDPQGIGGNYCLGMLGRIQDDKIAITIDRKDLDLINLRLNVSAIDVPRCGGPFGVDIPKFNFKLYDTPSGIWDFNNRGSLLDEEEAEGTTPGITPFIFNWAEIDLHFNAEDASAKHVTLLIDQIHQSGYAALDNFLVSSSTDSNKFTNQLTVLEGDTAWLIGSSTKDVIKNATISSSIGTASIDAATGEWYWEFVAIDGPDESQMVSVSIENDCEIEEFEFILTVKNVAPTVASNENIISTCGLANGTGTFFDPGRDTVTLASNLGNISYDIGKEGSWSWTSNNLNPNVDSLLILYATDSDGASDSLVIPILHQHPPIIINETISGSCPRVGLGSINLTVSGGCPPYSFLWNFGDTTANIDSVEIGMYWVKVTDKYGKTENKIFNVPNNNTLELTNNGDKIVYKGYLPLACDTLMVEASGGKPPYTLNWSNGSTESEIVVCPDSSKSFVATVTDSKGCTATSIQELCVDDIQVYDNGTAVPNRVYLTHKYFINRNLYTKTVIVHPSAVSHHLAHGDLLGAKGSMRCLFNKVVINEDEVLDDPFENDALIDHCVAFPNPFNPSFTLRIDASKSGNASIEVYDKHFILREKKSVELTAGISAEFNLGSELREGRSYVVKIVTKSDVFYHRLYKSGDACPTNQSSLEH
ncbi:SprB repeat-containing protein [Luteibaculum oceani]|nr:SprB repeat-containing protein [Luteibaculum oceani]